MRAANDRLDQQTTFLHHNDPWSLKLLKQIEKAPRGIQVKKSSKDMASSRNLVSTTGAKTSPKMWDGTWCLEG